MSQTIDNKVVEMDFDNKRFERNVSTSLSSIEKLKKSLNFDGMAKGFEDLGKSTSNLNFSSVGDAVETVKVKFSALQVFVLSAFKRMSDAAIDWGVNLVKSMGGVENIAAGWEKFAQKTQSVGTLIAQGYDMSTVENQLDKLAWFTDETSYEFTQMVESIAKFTAAGQSLPDSVESLMGIANWAALSGQNAQTASRAMYQLSQAMGSGIMRKEDYKSIQNVSMDTVEFRQRALDAAVALGTLKKNADGTYTSIAKGGKKSTFTISQFADHLTQEAWFTSDVMKAVYTDYAGAVDKIYNYVNENGGTASDAIKALSGDLDEFQIKAFKAAQEARTWKDTVDSVKEAVASTWMQTFEIIFGNYEEAKELWTGLANELYDVFAEPGNVRNELLGESLKSTKPFLNSYFRDTFGLSEEATEAISNVGETFGWASEEFDNYIAEISKGDAVMQNLIKGFYQIQEGSISSGESVRMSSEAFLSSISNYTSGWTRNKTITEEQAAKLRELGETYGYDSHELDKFMWKLHGTNWYAIEVTRNMLKAGAGLDTITESNIDEYLKTTNGLTDEQIGHLKELQNQYGANSDEINDYLKTLNQYSTGTRLNIMGVLGLAQGLSEAGEEIQKVDLESYIRKLSGATEDQTTELVKFYKAQKESNSSVDEYIDALAKENPLVASRLKNYVHLHSSEEISTTMIRHITGATEKEVDTLVKLIKTEEKNTEVVDDMIKNIAKGDPVIEESVRKMLSMNDEIKDLTGRQNLLSAFWSFWEYGASILGTVKTSFENVFPPITAERLYEITKNIREFAEGLQLSEENAKKLEDIFSGLFSIFKIIGQVGDALVLQPIRDLFELFSKHSGSILDTAASWGQWIKSVADSGEVGKVAQEIYSRFKQVLRELINFFKEFIDIEKIAETYNKNGGGLAGVIAVLKEKAEDLGTLFKDIFKIITGTDFSEFVENAKNAFNSAITWVDQFLPEGMKISGMLETISGFIDNVKERFSTITKIDFSEFSENVRTAFDSAIGWIDQFLPEGLKISEIFEAISGFIDNIKEKLGFGDENVDGAEKAITFFDRLKQAIKEASDNLSSFWGNMKKFFDDFSGIWETISNSGVLTGFSGIIKNMANGFKEIKISDVANLAEAGAGIFVGWNLMEFVKSIKKVPDAIGTVANSFKTLADGFKNFGFDGKKVAEAKAIQKFATSLLILVGALFLLSKIDEAKLTTSVLTLVGLSGMLIGVFEILEHTGKGKPVGTGMLKFAISIALLSFALAKIAGLPTKDIITAGLVISALAIALSAAQALMSFGKSSGKLMGSLSSLIFVKAIISLGEVVAKLGKEVKENDIIAAAGVISALTIVLGMAEYLMSFGSSLGKIAGAIGAIILMKGLIPLFEQLLDLMPKIAKAMKVFGDMGDDFWPTFGKFAAVIGLLAGALLAVGGAIGLISPAIVGIAKLVLAVGAAFALFGAGLNLIGLGLSTIGTGIATITPALELFGESFIKSLGKLFEGFAEMSPRIAEAAWKAFESFLSVVDNGLPDVKRSIVRLLNFGLDVTLSVIEDSTGRILASLFNVFSISLDELIKNGPELAGKVLELLLVILDFVSDNIATVVDKLANVIINVIDSVTNRIPDLAESFKKLVGAIFDEFVKAMEEVDIDEVRSAISAVEEFVGLMAILNGAALLTAGAMAGILGIGTVAAELAIVLTALGGLTAIPGIDDMIGNGGKLLATIGEALSGFITGFGEGLAKFAEIASSKDIDVEKVKQITEVGKMLSTLDVNGLASFFCNSKNAEGFAEGAKIFAEGLIDFANIVAEHTFDDTTLESIKSFMDVATTLSSFQKDLEPVNGFVQLIMGFKNLDTFGEQAEAFADSMKAFIGAIRRAEVDEDDQKLAERFMSIAAKVSSFQKDLEPVNGFVQLIMGFKNLDTFGEQAEAFGNSMKAFIGAIRRAEVDENDQKLAVQFLSVAEKLSTFQKGLERTNGFIQCIVGFKNLDTFGEHAEAFGNSMKAFIGAVRRADVNSNDQALAAQFLSVATKLSTFQKDLEPMNGVFQVFAGFKNLDMFGEQAEAFGNSMKAFVDAVKDTPSDTASIQNAIDIAAKLVDLQKTVQPIGGIAKLFWGFSSLTATGLDFAGFGLGLKGFIDAINLNIFGSDITKKIDNATKITSAISSLMSATPKSRQSYTLMKDNWKGIADAVKDFITTWSSIGDGGFDGLVEQAKTFVDAINILTGSSYNTSGGKTPGIVNDAKETVNGAVNVLESGGERARRAGERFVHEYDSGARSQVGPAVVNFESYMGEIGDAAVNESDNQGVRLDESVSKWGVEAVLELTKNGISIDEAIKMWGQEGLKTLTGSDVIELFRNVPAEWIDIIINSADAKSRDLYNVLKKIAADGGKSMTAEDILVLYRDGGVEMVQSLIDGGQLEASNVTRTLHDKILESAKKGVLDKEILDTYFALGGKLDESLANGISGIDSELGAIIKKAIESGASQLSLSDLIALYKKGGTGLADAVISGYGGDKEGLKNKVREMIVSGSYNGIPPADLLKLYQSLGGEVGDGMISGMNSKGTGVKNASASLAQKAADGASGLYSSGKSGGENFGSGVSRGIDNKKSYVESSATRLANAANNAFRTALAIASPSKVMIESGEYFAEGFIVGLDRMRNAVVTASSNSAQGALNGFTDTLKNLAKVNFDDVGDNLTIRPVMDLTDIQNGVNQIGSMMNGVNGYVINGSVAPAMAVANSMSRSGSVNPEQNSIDKLDQTVKELAKRPPKQVINNFAITSDDPEEVYEYVSSRMQNELEREETPWA